MRFGIGRKYFGILVALAAVALLLGQAAYAKGFGAGVSSSGSEGLKLETHIQQGSGGGNAQFDANTGEDVLVNIESGDLDEGDVATDNEGDIADEDHDDGSMIGGQDEGNNDDGNVNEDVTPGNGEPSDNASNSNTIGGVAIQGQNSVQVQVQIQAQTQVQTQPQSQTQVQAQAQIQTQTQAQTQHQTSATQGNSPSDQGGTQTQNQARDRSSIQNRTQLQVRIELCVNAAIKAGYSDEEAARLRLALQTALEAGLDAEVAERIALEGIRRNQLAEEIHTMLMTEVRLRSRVGVEGEAESKAE